MALVSLHTYEYFETFIGKITGSRRFGIPLLFAIFAAPVFLAVAFLVVRAEQDAATNILIQSTEIQNANLARTMSNAHSDPISYLLAFDIGDAPELLPIAIRRSGLEAIVRDSLEGTNIFNMKIYDGNGVTLFSLDESHLGENISACVCFANALSGNTTSELIRVGEGHHSVGNSGSGGDHGGHGSSVVGGGQESSIAGGDHAGHGAPEAVDRAAQHGEHGAVAPEFVPHVEADVDVLTTMIHVSTLATDLVASDSILEIQSDVTNLLATINAARGDVYRTVGFPLAALYIALVLIVIFGRLLVLRWENEARVLASKVAESEAANQAKSEFLSLMSHELRTPLNAIIGFSELIEQNEQDNEESETAGYARTIHESGHHMLRQVISILDMTAIELGKLDLDGVPVDIHEIAREAVQNVQPNFDRGLVTLDVHDTMPLPMVQGDPTKLREVFENLLSNAARFTPAGGTVDLLFGTEPGGWVCVGIKDTGVGMTREQIDRARLPFQQNWNGMSREADGAGLGLTIADKIVTQLGGEIVIESQKEVGTKIIVRLPAAEDADLPDDHGEMPSLMAAE